MKALIGFVSMAFGAFLVLAMVKIQIDPFAFTSFTRYTPAAIGQPAAPVTPPTPAEPVTHVITLADVTIVAAMSRHVLPARRATVQARVAAAPVEPRVKVLPAPCVDGQYRKLEAHRGVRLMCPH
jgi:hypothetical protein